MGKEYKYQDEAFQIDDSKGCYVEVSHQGQVIGHVGVALQGGTSELPYRWDFSQLSSGRFAYGSRVAKDGIASGGAGTASLQTGLIEVCRVYLRQLKEIRQQQEFNPEEACQSLHQQFKDLA